MSMVFNLQDALDKARSEREIRFTTMAVAQHTAEQREKLLTYLRSLGEAPTTPLLSQATPLPPIAKTVGGVIYEAQRRRVQTVTRENRFFLSDFVDALWPGSLVQSRPLAERGELSPVRARRSPGVIVIIGDLHLTPDNWIAQYRNVAKPTLANVNQARQEILQELDPQQSHGRLDLHYVKVKTFQQALLHLGLGAKFLGVHAEGQLDEQSNYDTSTVAFSLMQEYYSVGFNPETDIYPINYIHPDADFTGLQQDTGVQNPPALISSVTYGRHLLVVATSSDGADTTAGNVKAGFQDIFNVDFSGSKRAEQHQVQLDITSIGANGVNPMQHIITDDVAGAIADICGQDATFNLGNPGAPIHMLARSIGTGLLIPNTLSADYNEAFNLAGKDFDTEIAVYEGTEGGKRLTGIQVAGGDTVTFEAHGSIWCGVFGAGRNGPDGWTGWVARGNDWPLPGSKVHMLIGSWDGVHWWEIGSGGSVTREPADPASFLWLHINDNDPYNGNGQFDVQIHVRRAARTAPGIGFAP